MKKILLIFLFVSPLLSFGDVRPLGNQVLGEGTYSWFFFDVYKATLRSESKDNLFEKPLSLELVYLRNFSGSDISKQSVIELESQGVSTEELKEWSKLLDGLFPNVKDGDQILANYDPSEGLTFYLNRSTKLGRISSIDYSKSFLNIWLSKKSSAKELRKKLLGMK
jgi:hypothetical protein